MPDTQIKSEYGIENMGFDPKKNVYWNSSVPFLYEQLVGKREGFLSKDGAAIMETGKHTARAAKDKFIVEEDTSKADIWWGDYNVPIGEDKFDNLLSKLMAYFNEKDIYVQDCFAGSNKEHRLPIRIITEHAWQSLFSKYIFIEADADESVKHIPQFTVICAPDFKADPETDGVRTGTFILVNFKKKMVIIGGSGYAGEIKKSIFSVMNHLMPLKGVMSMHCSANIGEKDDTAIFFGLSGTGKTTLSSDPKRRLIGDDQHGWSDDGIFNYEGGCYAKVINLSQEAEPQIYKAVNSFGAVLENVVFDKKTRELKLDDNSLTENTRGAYPLTYIPNSIQKDHFSHPKNIVMLTYDAFGVLPPISKLSYEQAMYHFISGYTAKVANTEIGIVEPVATFSTCFGAPFMSHHPKVYAKLLGEKIKKHNVNCWLINTGLIGGPYGVGKRISIKHTRELLNSAIEGGLDNIEFVKDSVFGFDIPQKVGDLPAKVLNPSAAWEDKADYEKKHKELASLFIKNFKKFNIEDEDICNAGPKV